MRILLLCLWMALYSTGVTQDSQSISQSIEGTKLSSEAFDKAMEELRKTRYTEVTMEISYYTANDEGMDGRGITTSGTKATQGRTVAMSSQYPLGTQICIDGHWYVNEDRGGYIVGNRVDVFVESRSEALELGRQRKTVKVRE